MENCIHCMLPKIIVDDKTPKAIQINEDIFLAHHLWNMRIYSFYHSETAFYIRIKRSRYAPLNFLPLILDTNLMWNKTIFCSNLDVK